MLGHGPRSLLVPSNNTRDLPESWLPVRVGRSRWFIAAFRTRLVGFLFTHATGHRSRLPATFLTAGPTVIAFPPKSRIEK